MRYLDSIHTTALESEFYLHAAMDVWTSPAGDDVKVTMTSNRRVRPRSSFIFFLTTTKEHGFHVRQGQAESDVKVLLRRCEAHGIFIQWHSDQGLWYSTVMQVALNNDSEYDGGRLLYITAASGFSCPSHPAVTATFHDKDVVHAVSTLASGARYGLFLLA